MSTMPYFHLLILWILMFGRIAVASSCEAHNDCPTGWRSTGSRSDSRGSLVGCFKYGKSLATFKAAQSACQDAGGVLISQEVAREASQCLSVHHPNDKASRKKIWVDDGTDDKNHCPLFNVAVKNLNYPKKCSYRRYYVCYTEATDVPISPSETKTFPTSTAEPSTSLPSASSTSTSTQRSTTSTFLSSTSPRQYQTSSSTYPSSSSSIIYASITSTISQSPQERVSSSAMDLDASKEARSETTASWTSDNWQTSGGPTRSFSSVWPTYQSSPSSRLSGTSQTSPQSKTYTHTTPQRTTPFFHTSNTTEKTTTYSKPMFSTTSQPRTTTFWWFRESDQTSSKMTSSAEPTREETTEPDISWHEMSSSPAIPSKQVPKIPPTSPNFAVHASQICIDTDFSVDKIDEYQCRIEPIMPMQTFNRFTCVWLNVFQEMTYNQAEQHCQRMFGTSLLGKEALDSVPTQCILLKFPSTIWVKSDLDPSQDGECLTFDTYDMNIRTTSCSDREKNHFVCSIKRGAEEIKSPMSKSPDLEAFCPQDIQVVESGETFIALSFKAPDHPSDEDEEYSDVGEDDDEVENIRLSDLVDLTYTVDYVEFDGNTEREDFDNVRRWKPYGLFEAGGYLDSERSWETFENDSKEDDSEDRDSGDIKKDIDSAGSYDNKSTGGYFGSVNHSVHYNYTDFDFRKNSSFSKFNYSDVLVSETKINKTNMMRKRSTEPLIYLVTTNENEESFRIVNITDLDPNTQYRFRVNAIATFYRESLEGDGEMGVWDDIPSCGEIPVVEAKTKKIEVRKKETVEQRPFMAMVQIMHHILCASVNGDC